MYVYVIYDPLVEKVLCVHEKSGMVCRTCDKKKYHKRNAYQLYENKRKIVNKER
jgi:hypothetical protein